MQWIYKHFEHHQNRTWWDFCWRTTLEKTLIAIIAAFCTEYFVTEPARSFGSSSKGQLIFYMVVLAPIVETFFFQAIPIGIARQFRTRLRTQILVSIVPFMLGHLVEGVGTGIAAGLIGGFYLAFTYATWVEKTTVGKAMLITVFCHALGNAIIVPIILLAF
jgi:hypothetical protein